MNRPLLAFVVVVAVIAAGCGGASDETGGDATPAGSGSGGSLSLVAYSTPQVVYDEIIPDFAATPDRKSVV